MRTAASLFLHRFRNHTESSRMDPNNKAQLRVILAQRMAEYEAQKGAIKVGPASVERYIRALTQIEPDITSAQRQMLIGHALAPRQTLTMTELAHLAGGEGYYFANAHYGALGRLLTEALGLVSPKWWVYTLATFEDLSGANGRVAQMHPTLLDALVQLGWIPGITSALNQVAKRPHIEPPIVLSSEAVIEGIMQAGFARKKRENIKVARFHHPDTHEVLYVKLTDSKHPRQRTPLVVAPRFEAHVSDWLQIPGVIGGDEQYFHNDDMGEFPKRKHTGKSSIHYGIDLGVLSTHALQTLLAEWLKSSVQPMIVAPETPPVTSAIPDYSLEGIAQNDTERDALIKARIGQSAYRNALLAYWQKCAVTGCGAALMLRASHIKPWHQCTDQERLDPYNGLLLAPHLDVAFDQGLISFEDDGRIMLSPKLCDSDSEVLGLRSELKLRKVTVEHRAYLAWHREEWFKGGA